MGTVRTRPRHAERKGRPESRTAGCPVGLTLGGHPSSEVPTPSTSCTPRRTASPSTWHHLEPAPVALRSPLPSRPASLGLGPVHFGRTEAASASPARRVGGARGTCSAEGRRAVTNPTEGATRTPPTQRRVGPRSCDGGALLAKAPASGCSGLHSKRPCSSHGVSADLPEPPAASANSPTRRGGAEGGEWPSPTMSPHRICPHAEPRAGENRTGPPD